MCVKKGSHSNSVSSWRSVVCVSMMCLDLWGVVGDDNDDDDDDDDDEVFMIDDSLRTL